jgi:hypothetical protein
LSAATFGALIIGIDNLRRLSAAVAFERAGGAVAGSWTTPFTVSLRLLPFGAVMTYRFGPDRPPETVPSVG